MDKPFEEVYFNHRLSMFFRETKETEKDIVLMFHQIREKMKQRVVLKNKKKKGAKKSGRALAIKTIRALDGKAKMRRAELVQHLQAEGYTESEADEMLRKLHSAGLVKCTVGKFSEAYVA